MTAQQDAYTGVDNLEVMREARNYNDWLLRLIGRHAPARGRAIDFGAGSGTFALPMQRAGLTMTCLEPEEQKNWLKIYGKIVNYCQNK